MIWKTHQCILLLRHFVFFNHSGVETAVKTSEAAVVVAFKYATFMQVIYIIVIRSLLRSVTRVCKTNKKAFQ